MLTFNVANMIAGIFLLLIVHGFFLKWAKSQKSSR